MELEQAIEYLNCSLIGEDEVLCNGTEYDLPEVILTYKDKLFWIYIGIYTGLVIFAGLVSGLTMGLLSLDHTTLMTIKAGGTPTERKHAARILPIVKRHHLLLVTLLLSNAVAVEAMPIFLDKVSNPVIAIVISVTAVLIFGEVIPQAVCTRYGLAIGYYMAPFVYFLMVLFFIISYPFSLILDCLLGKEHGTLYRRGQLKALIDIHGEEAQISHGHEGGGSDALSKDEVVIIKGCLDMRHKEARHAMMGIEKAYMLDIGAKLDFDTMTEIINKGHSRVPVYDGDHAKVRGCLITKTLIKFDPDDAVPVSTLIHDSRYARPPLFINADNPLFDLLNKFQTGKSHLALVKEVKVSNDDDKLLIPDIDHDEQAPLLVNNEEPSTSVAGHPRARPGTVIGIITLEDVIEELLQEEIEDETDIKREISQKLAFSFAKRNRSVSTSFDEELPTDAQVKRTLSVPTAAPSDEQGNTGHGQNSMK